MSAILISGLFHRAITISGSALNPWTMHSHPALAAQELAENLDCPKEPSAALAECLKAVDFRKLVRVNTHVRLQYYSRTPSNTFAICTTLTRIC